MFTATRRFGKTGWVATFSPTKKTFLLIHALATAKGKDKAELQHWLAAKIMIPEKGKCDYCIVQQTGCSGSDGEEDQSYFDLGFADLLQLSAGSKRRRY